MQGPMLPVSLVLITYNEADRVGDAIRSAPGVAEVLVLDSGSTDGTPEQAQALGARVERVDWPGHVAQKQRAWERATQPWVLSLDADERLSPALAAALPGLLEGPASAWALRRRNHYLGTPVRGGSFGPRWHVRLARKEQARWGGQDPHDRLEALGRVGRAPGFLEHHPYRDLGEHLATLDRYSATFAERAWAAGRRAAWWDVGFRPPLHFVANYFLRMGFVDGTLGVQLAWLGACHVALKWSRLRARAEQR